MRQTLPEDARRPLRVLIEQAPPEHAGLGAGTALGLAVARAITTELGFPHLSAVELAAAVGRGERSAVGVHGFDRGGLVWEAGKLTGETVSPLIERVALPADWRVLVFLPAGAGGWHGSAEKQAFATTAGTRPDTAAELVRLVEQDILPAAKANDVQAFGAAVTAYNRLAGEPFRDAQGGGYASPEAEALINELLAAGLPGAGQSSWGPGVFAVAGDAGHARFVQSLLADKTTGYGSVMATPTAGGAAVERG